MKDLIYKTWQDILSLLSENGYILRIEDIPSKLQNKVNPQDWHHGDDYAFYDHCIRNQKNISQEDRVFFEDDLDDPSKKVLYQKKQKFPETLKFDEKKKELEILAEKKRVETATRLYRDGKTFKEFVRKGDKMALVTDHIKEGTYYRCLAGKFFF